MAPSGSEASLAPATEEDTNAAITALFASLGEMCAETMDKIAQGDPCEPISPDQTEDLLVNLPQWYKSQWLPAIRIYESANGKNLEKAYELEKMAEAFADMQQNDRQFTKKAFSFLNKAIKYAPLDEANFMCECFAQRAELHAGYEEYASALSDMEKALHFRPHSFTLINRKIDMLKSMEKYAEACKFITAQLKSKLINEKLSKNKLEQLEKMGRKLRRSHPDIVESEDESCEVKEQVESKVDTNQQTDSIKGDKRMRVVRNALNGRFELKAIEFIPQKITLLEEKPQQLVLKSEGLESLCAHCWAKCRNTFWPCANCSDVIYCSHDCALANEQQHKAECRIFGLIAVKYATNAMHVYRHLVRIGHEKWIEVYRNEKSFPLDNRFEQLFSDKAPTKDELEQLFIYAQGDLLRMVEQRKTPVTAEEIGCAILILCMYAYKHEVLLSSLDAEQRFAIVHILYTDLAKVAVNEYTWKNDSDKKLANFQCLVGSRVGPACESNAEWHYENNRFVLRSSKAIKPGQPITIAFGVSPKDPFFERQAQVHNFMVMCSCTKCMEDSSQNFCLRCPTCNGPVPWHATQFDNSWCMLCERKCDSMPSAASIQQGLKSVQKLIWLVRSTKCSSNSEYLDSVSTQMVTMANHIHLQNEQFLSVVRDMCELYFSLDMYSDAVSWHEWLSERGVSLCAAKDFEGQNDTLVEFHFLDKWVHAYVSLLQTGDYTVPERMHYVSVLTRLLTPMNELLEQWKKGESTSPHQSDPLAQQYGQVAGIMTSMLESKATICKEMSKNLIEDIISVGEENNPPGVELYETAQQS